MFTTTWNPKSSLGTHSYPEKKDGMNKIIDTLNNKDVINDVLIWDNEYLIHYLLESIKYWLHLFFNMLILYKLAISELRIP